MLTEYANGASANRAPTAASSGRHCECFICLVRAGRGAIGRAPTIGWLASERRPSMPRRLSKASAILPFADPTASEGPTPSHSKDAEIGNGNSRPEACRPRRSKTARKDGQAPADRKSATLTHCTVAEIFYERLCRNSRRRTGGAEGIRTPDLCSAIAALSHLSYSPGPRAQYVRKRRVSTQERVQMSRASLCGRLYARDP